MSAKAIREATGKELINKYLEGGSDIGVAQSRCASVNEATQWNELLTANPWLETTVSKTQIKLNINGILEWLQMINFELIAIGIANQSI